MEKSIQAVRDTGKIAEAAICYTGDINDQVGQNTMFSIIKTWQRN